MNVQPGEVHASPVDVFESSDVPFFVSLIELLPCSGAFFDSTWRSVDLRDGKGFTGLETLAGRIASGVNVPQWHQMSD